MSAWLAIFPAYTVQITHLRAPIAILRTFSTIIRVSVRVHHNIFHTLLQELAYFVRPSALSLQ